MTIQPGLVRDEDGTLRGVDPRHLSQEQLAHLGHEVQPVLSIIRAKCLDCCHNMRGEVKRCTVVSCALWPLRMGKNPFRQPREAREMSEEHLEKLRIGRERFQQDRRAQSDDE